MERRLIRDARYHTIAMLGGGMSQQTVGLIVERLLTDEQLRMQFACYPLETIVDLQEEGLELTPGEIDILLPTDAQT
jgi:hypothetical protein